MNIHNYDIFIFDSDGVILNSNKIKIDAFCEIGELLLKVDCKTSINKFISNNSKSSREDILSFLIKEYEKISYYNLKDDDKDSLLKKLLNNYDFLTKSKLLNCERSYHLSKLRYFCRNIPWILLTLGDEKSTKYIYDKRNLTQFFDLGIFGGPIDKHNNIKIIKEKINLNDKRIVFFGDTINDAKLAKINNFEFIFLSDWSYCPEVREFCRQNNYIEYANLDFFISSLIQ